MFAGHFGIAAAAKAKAPMLPLWVLLVATQLIDIIFFLFYALGLEWMETTGYGGATIHAFYSHSLIVALLVSWIAVLIGSKKWGRGNGWVLGAVVFSHWLLDLLVHRPDLPLLPGNIGNMPLLGFGLWNMPVISLCVEALLLLGGWFLYTRYVWRDDSRSTRLKRVMKSTCMGIFFVCMLLMDTL
ncbi:permease [Aureibacillus halotolerans]|uniref:LexA-binding, inner membrane-associated hydrolase n=1 Tax=Aureibacillus halotolerans TaxID=1508390 RepID=A0A4R6UFW3_9BACI|nr:permease [Aureibacillus halotolerans]TDQ42034.1 hypothetical protein EV213_10262 [Aureibacillus halotolerans]